MKRLLLILALAHLLIMADSADVYGGRGGGGRGGGGGSRGGGGGGGRSPSMSRSGGSRPAQRPTNRPTDRPTGRPTDRPTQRPSSGHSPSFSQPGGGRPSQTPSNRPGGGIGSGGGGTNRPGGSASGGLGNRPDGGRPSSGDVGNFLGMPTQGGGRPSQRPAGGIGSGGNRPNNPGSGVGNRQNGGLLGPGGANRPTQLPANRPGGGGIGDRGVNRDGVGNRGGIANRPSQLPARGDRNAWNSYRSNRATNIRNVSGNNVNFNRVVNRNGGFWGGGGYGHGYAHGWAASNRYHGWGNCWGWHGCSPGLWWGVGTSAVALTSFCVGLAVDHDDEPKYYNYGDTVYVENNTVYQDGQQVASQQDYAAQAIQYASVEVPPPPEVPADPATETPEQGASMQQYMDNWMALGVFAVGREQDDNATPRFYLQLAVSKDGYIAGTCFDSVNDKTVPVTGSVDKESQRAAWKLADRDDVVMETGIYNLTQDTAPALLHFGKDKTESRLLVRMDQPKEGAGGAPAPAPGG